VLPIQFVTGKESPLEYLSNIDGASYCSHKAGFNLVVADLGNPPQEKLEKKSEAKSAADEEEEEDDDEDVQNRASSTRSSQVYYMTNATYFGDTNAPKDPIPLPPGVHGLSNAVLDTPWPKVALGRRRFDDLAGDGAFDGDEFPWEAVFDIMKDSTVLETDPAKLPQTGYGPEFESAASALCMDPPVIVENTLFGTRSITIMVVPRDCRIPAELREQYLTEEGGWAEERHQFQMKIAEHPPKLD
jgi:uncharacterized protein with NRDE domain